MWTTDRILTHWYHILKLLTIVILKSLVRFTNMVIGSVEHSWLVEVLHLRGIDILVVHLVVPHCRLAIGVEWLLLLLLHIKLLPVLVLMQSLWRVIVGMDLLVVLVHLTWHLHVLAHAHLTLRLHLLVQDTHLLSSHVLVLHVLWLSVLYVFHALLMWLHLINSFLILLI